MNVDIDVQEHLKRVPFDPAPTADLFQAKVLYHSALLCHGLRVQQDVGGRQARQEAHDQLAVQALSSQGRWQGTVTLFLCVMASR